jgi:hypothetical protein
VEALIIPRQALNGTPRFPPPVPRWKRGGKRLKAQGQKRAEVAKWLQTLEARKGKKRAKKEIISKEWV